MSSIGLFPCLFVPYNQVAEILIDRLGLTPYQDKDLLADTAAKYGVGADKLKRMLYERTSVFNPFTLEREGAFNMFRSVLADRLEEPENWLFQGVHTLLIPDRVTHVLKVLVIATKKQRIETGLARGLSLREAKKAVHAADLCSYNCTDFLYKKEAYDNDLYDLVIPAAGKQAEQIATEIIHAFRKTAVLQTTDSQQAVADMRLETRVERILLNNGHKMDVRAAQRKITITAQDNVLSFSRLSRELGALAKKIPGVDEVEVKKNPEYSESIYRRQRFELPSKVLFVDDEKEFVRTVSERLISRDVGTYGVYNGEDALELVVEDKPDVMVLDLKMPGLSGVEVLRRTKEIAPDVEVIILTGHGTSQDMQECMALGAYAYMNKPVDIEELSATIKAANEKAQLKVA